MGSRASAEGNSQYSLVVGESTLKRLGFRRFPVWELANEGEILARLGRISGWSIYFGFGLRVELADGSVWRVTSSESSEGFTAIVRNSQGEKLGVASVGPTGYGIHGRDFSYLLFASVESRITTPNIWTLSSPEAECAEVRRHPLTFTAYVPVPTVAVVLAHVLVRVGIPGDKKLEMPGVHWTKR